MKQHPKAPHYVDDSGEIVYLAWEFAVCDRCRGTGKHVNPAIDGNGISTSSELWADDDFRSMYMSGAYDVTCSECNGERVVPELDSERVTEEQFRKYMAQRDWEYEDAMVRRAEQGWLDL